MAKKEDNTWQHGGKYLVTVHFGGERFSKILVKADSFGGAIKKIVDDYMKEYPEGFDFDSEIRFVREIFDELK